MEKILFCYFSGTGNTRLVVERMTDVFRRSGSDVEIRKIHRDLRVEPEEGTAVGLAFPVAYQSTYPFVWHFAKNLPASRSNSAFMVDTLGGFSGGVVGPLGRLMRKKGYSTVGAEEISMPVNIRLFDFELERERENLNRGLAKAEGFARALLEGNTRWGRVPVLSELMLVLHWATVILVFSRFSQRKFKITCDETVCTGCGVCASECPVENVTMEVSEQGHAVPLFGDICEFCLRCTAVCPVAANSFRLSRHGDYRSSDILQDSN
ncbi:MAG: 4Fe-4S ferredoxin [Candidatus Aegiribacteria sp.]|nr:4Fe-4S ferredoxin [Candidatus Aegiribacteria sp.]MBD3294006.1 4Fe-4S ferredoxin [Candidatus Fermentibacteria bacterium]